MKKAKWIAIIFVVASIILCANWCASETEIAGAYDKNGIELTEDEVINNPVNRVSWYDAIVYCNKLSMEENLTPCYIIDESTDPEDWGTYQLQIAVHGML